VQLACNIGRRKTVANSQQGLRDPFGSPRLRLAFPLVKAVVMCPYWVVRGRVELPTFRFSACRLRTNHAEYLYLGTCPSWCDAVRHEVGGDRRVRT